MANRLLKFATTEVITQGRPAVPYRPAYTVSYTVYEFEPTTGGNTRFGSGAGAGGGGRGEPSVRVTDSLSVPRDVAAAMAAGAAGGRTGRPAQPASGSAGANAGKMVPVTRTIHYPAQPAIPAVAPVIMARGAADWDGGARSIALAGGGVQFRFRVSRSAIGILCGLSAFHRPRSFAAVDYGFHIHATGVTVVESGRTRVTISGVVLADQPEFAVRRVLNRIDYLVDGVVRYTSQTLDNRPLFGDAVLYSPLDTIDSPVLEPAEDGGVAGRLRIIGNAYATAYAEVVGYVPLPNMLAGVANDAVVDGRVPAPVPMIADYEYAFAGGQVPRPGLTVTFRGPEVGLAGVAGLVCKPLLSAILRVGSVGRVDSAAPAPKPLIADYNYAYGGGVWPMTGYRMGMWEDHNPYGVIVAGSDMLLLDYIDFDYPIVMIMHDGLQLVDSNEITVAVGIVMQEVVALLDSLTFTAALRLVMQETLRLSSAGATAAAAGHEYAVDVATGALVQYQGLGLRHFTRTADGRLWGVSPDGICGLASGAQVAKAVVDLGTSELGTSQMKRLSVAFLGLRTDGEVYLRVVADGREQVYRARNTGANNLKVPLAKGVAARHWQFVLEVEDASFATFDSLEVEVGTSQRRIDR